MLKRKAATREINFTQDMLRSLQRVQLEILTEVDRICRKHNIKYSLDGGTLLGAVRHKGFIPWDDDIDLIMLRPEYERFFVVCESELDNARFFLQEHRTDPHYRVGYTRIRRKKTVYLRAGQEKSRQRTGILIDLFVLDHIPNHRVLRRVHWALSVCFRKILWAKTGKVVSGNALLRMWFSILSLIPAGFCFFGFNALRYLSERKPAKNVRHYAMPYPNPRLNTEGIPAGLLNHFTELDFEGKKFFCVAGYHNYLALLYGDYMKLPPPEKRKPHIHLSAFDAEIRERIE